VRESLVPEIPLFVSDDPAERGRILSYHFRRVGILVDGALSLFCAALERRVIAEVGSFHRGGTGIDGEDYCRRIGKARYVIGLALDAYVIRHTPDQSRIVTPVDHRHLSRRHPVPSIR
jgi:hypothetical protein